MSATAPDLKPLLIAVGDNPARAFGMAADARAAALGIKAGMEPATAPQPGRGSVLADLDFAWDPAWARAIAQRPGTALVKDGRAVLVHLADGAAVDPVAAAMRDQAPARAGRADDPRRRPRRIVQP